MLPLQASPLVMAWQPVEAIWSDPQVLAYLDGPAPTSAEDQSQPLLRIALLSTSKALNDFKNGFARQLDDVDSVNIVRSGTVALVQSKALLLLGCISHWLQRRSNLHVVENVAAPTWSGSYTWKISTVLLSQLMMFLTQMDGTGLVACHRSACAQLLASGEPLNAVMPTLGSKV